MPASLAACNATATAAALDGDTAMPSTFLATRSCTTCTCSSPPPCSPGPMYMHSTLPAISFSAFLQPSRAWSKNGLFMFFGTSANTSLPSTAPATPGRPNSPAIAATINVFFIISSSCPNRPGLSPRAHPTELAQQHRKHNEQTYERTFPVCIHTSQKQTVPDHFDQGRAD